MTAHLDGLAAVTRVLSEQPVPPASTVAVHLRHPDGIGPSVALNLHETPAALTAALVDALGITRNGSYLVTSDGFYRVTTFGSVVRYGATHFGPHLSRQAWRTASRADVRRVSA